MPGADVNWSDMNLAEREWSKREEQLWLRAEKMSNRVLVVAPVYTICWALLLIKDNPFAAPLLIAWLLSAVAVVYWFARFLVAAWRLARHRRRQP